MVNMEAPDRKTLKWDMDHFGRTQHFVIQVRGLVASPKSQRGNCCLLTVTQTAEVNVINNVTALVSIESDINIIRICLVGFNENSKQPYGYAPLNMSEKSEKATGTTRKVRNTGQRL